MATSGGSGGNTTTGEAARKVYRLPELRGRLVDLCPPEHKFVFEAILFHSESSPHDLSPYYIYYVFF